VIGGKINVQPNPASSGGSVTISVEGGGVVFVRVDGSSGGARRIEIPADPGSVTISVPVEGQGSFTVADNDSGPVTEEVIVEVVETGI